tara:strand:+ start:7043 stop:7282 length:240 start_codon:yes stop_codon:yes gene_type:complete
MFSCALCEKETVYVVSLCNKCRRIKHLLNLYDERVYEVLESVLVRNVEGQNNKVDNVLKKDLEKREYNLRKKNKLNNIE